MEIRKYSQPMNKQRNTNAILVHYENRISEQYPNSIWEAHAFQKDGIQNSYGASVSKKLNDWSCTLFLNRYNGIEYAGIVDSGTSGLKGRVPDPDNGLSVTDILNEVEDTELESDENLAYFLSSDFTNKTGKSTPGSRGRGKTLFYGSSNDTKFYFDSLRQDGSYIFGSVELDKKTKDIQEYCLEGDEADENRSEIFGESLVRLSKTGTRILIPNPKKQLVESFRDDSIVGYIQETWWEILERHDATILVDNYGNTTKVLPSDWLGVEKLSEKYQKAIYDKVADLKLRRNPTLSIKKISLCFVGDPKIIPENYQGIAFSRDGMVIQRIQTKTLLSVDGAAEIFGTVELSDNLSIEVKENYEDPEHYWINFNKGVGLDIRDSIKSHLNQFADDIGLGNVEDERKIKRDSEIEVQKRLNNLAKKLGFKMTGIGKTGVPRKQPSREPVYPMRLSFAGLETVQGFGRVDYGEYVSGATVVPVCDDSNVMTKVKVTCWVIYKGVGGKMNDPIDISDRLEKVVKIFDIEPLSDLEHVGWDELRVDKHIFSESGVYHFKARMDALETFSLRITKKDHAVENVTYRKGDSIGDTIQAPFYVEIDKPDSGLFDLSSVKSDDKNNYFRWDTTDGISIKYNQQHPIFKRIQNIKPKKDQLIYEQDEIARIGSTVLATIAYEEDKLRVENGDKPVIYDREDIDINSTNMSENSSKINDKMSELFWELMG